MVTNSEYLLEISLDNISLFRKQVASSLANASTAQLCREQFLDIAALAMVETHHALELMAAIAEVR